MAEPQCILNLEHLPQDVLNEISLLCDGIHLINFSKVSTKMLAASNLVKRHCDFSKSSYIPEQMMIDFLESNQESIASLNVNHCLWLTEHVFDKFKNLNQLKELHAIDCCNPHSIISLRKCPTGLKSLSLTWKMRNYTHIYKPNNGNEIENFPYYDSIAVKVSENDETYLSELFGNLKHLELFVPVFVAFDFTEISNFVLKYCQNLETFKLTSADAYNDDDDGDIVQFEDELPWLKDQPFVPKLKEFYMDLKDFCETDEYVAQKFILAITKNKPQIKLYLGNLSANMFDHYVDHLPCKHENYCDAEEHKLVNQLSVKEMDTICLDFPPEEENNIIRPIPAVWKHLQNTCKNVSMRNAEFQNFPVTCDLISQLGPKLRSLDFSGSSINSDELVEGWENIALNCPDIAHLNLSVANIFAFNQPEHIKILFTSLSQMTALKSLHITSGLFRYYVLPPAISSKEDQYIDLSLEDNLRQSHFFDVGENCQNIEEFGLHTIQNSTVSVRALGCISLFQNLKKLVLTNLSLKADGNYMEVILKNCNKLETLHMSYNIKKTAFDHFYLNLTQLPYAKNLKNLSVIHGWDLDLDSLLIALSGCSSLEKILVKPLKNGSTTLENVDIVLNILPNLQYFCQTCSEGSTDFIRLKSEVGDDKKDFVYKYDCVNYNWLSAYNDLKQNY
ncbi:hypothetical protein CHUAL_000137 [Chamberlinius hualienensis]